ncbi:MAG: glycosyltransferase, partial [Prosthecobacter sp.]|uniref:glycosyltransferase n=1 Tax=Prosthecobacter sp. TaxID=1965333 RepID=UPI003902C0F3
ELIDRLGGGHLVPPENPRLLAEKLEMVLSDLPAARALGLQGRKAVMEHSTTRHEAERLLRILGGLRSSAV